MFNTKHVKGPDQSNQWKWRKYTFSNVELFPALHHCNCLDVGNKSTKNQNKRLCILIAINPYHFKDYKKPSAVIMWPSHLLKLPSKCHQFITRHQIKNTFTKLWPFSRCILLASRPMSWVATSPSLGPGKMLGDRPSSAWFIDSPFWCTALEWTENIQHIIHTSTHSQTKRKTPPVINNDSAFFEKRLFSSSGQRRWVCPWLSTVCDLWCTSSPNQCASQSKSHLPLFLARAILSAVLYYMTEFVSNREYCLVNLWKIYENNNNASLMKFSIHQLFVNTIYI